MLDKKPDNHKLFFFFNNISEKIWRYETADHAETGNHGMTDKRKRTKRQN